MCGLFGFQFTPGIEVSEGQRTLLTFLLGQGAEKRGRDSTGFAAYRGTDAIVLEKELGAFTASTLILNAAQYMNIIGHTRFATVGARTVENAHPFEYRHIIGAHNGGIYNYHDVARKYNKRNFDVDSQHLIAHIANGYDFKELTGYGAVTWFDKRVPGVVYLCRMRNGDLVLEELSEGRGLVWASTTSIISEALRPLGWYATSKSKFLTEGRVYRLENGVVAETDMRIELSGEGKKKGGYNTTVYDASGKKVEQTAKGTVTTYPSTTYYGPHSWQRKGGDAPQGATKSDEIIGSVVRIDKNSGKRAKERASDIAAYEAAVREYDRDLEHYQRGVEYGTQCSRPVGKILPGDNLLDLVCERFVFSRGDYECVCMHIDSLSRRSRRKYETLAKETAKHKGRCRCVKCAKVLAFVTKATANNIESY